MSIRFLPSSALVLALLLFADPSSAVTLTVLGESENDIGYGLSLLVTSDGGPNATFSSCADGNCIWDISITFSEAGGGLVNWSGSGTHGSADTYSFTGSNGTTFEGSVAHGAGTDFYSGAHIAVSGGLTLPQGEFILGARHVPEPAAGLLLGYGLIGLGCWRTRLFRTR